MNEKYNRSIAVRITDLDTVILDSKLHELRIAGRVAARSTRSDIVRVALYKYLYEGNPGEPCNQSLQLVRKEAA